MGVRGSYMRIDLPPETFGGAWHVHIPPCPGDGLDDWCCGRSRLSVIGPRRAPHGASRHGDRAVGKPSPGASTRTGQDSDFPSLRVEVLSRDCRHVVVDALALRCSDQAGCVVQAFSYEPVEQDGQYPSMYEELSKARPSASVTPTTVRARTDTSLATRGTSDSRAAIVHSSR
jgi:hypothetical protein